MAIADDLVGHAHVSYLGDPFEQYCGLNGKPLIGGWIEVYQAGTDTKYITMQNFDGAMNPFKVPLNADGRVVMLADPSLTYDMYVRNSYGDLVCSRLNVECTCPGNISIKGLDTWVRNTDGTLDVSLQTSANNRRVFTVNTHSKLLDVQEPLYFVENSNTATVIGFSGDNYVQKDYLNDFVASSISGKMDESKLEFNSHDEISAYNGSAFAGGQGDPEVNDLVHEQSATWNEVTGKLDATAFDPNEFYPSTNPSGFINKTSADELYQPTGNYASATDLTAYQTIEGMTAYQPSGDYATHDDLTAYQTVDGMSAYQPSGDYATKDEVSALDNKINDVSAAIPDVTNFLTKSSADTLYQPLGDYATHDDLTAYQTVEGMTAYQLSGDYADATALDGKVDTSSFSSFSSTTNEKIEYISGALSGTYELSAGSGIDITDYPNEQKTVISVTAEGGNKEVENLVIANSATWDSVTCKADADDLTAYQTIAGMTAYQPSGDYQPAGEYLSANALDDVSATWNDVTAKVDTTAMTGYVSIDTYTAATAKISELEGIISAYSARWLLA